MVAVTLASCSDKKIGITSDYIINANWNNQANAIKINKLRLKKDSIINPYSALNEAELLEKLEDDTSFLFVANVTIMERSTQIEKFILIRIMAFFGGRIKGKVKHKL